MRARAPSRRREIALVRGDRDDVFSHGYLCPKGTALKHLEADPDRVRTPLVRDGDEFREVSWDEAFAVIDAGLAPIREQHGNDALAVYLGNPSAHNLAGLVYNRVRAAGGAHAERLLGEHRRPDAEAGVGRADVRRRAHDSGSRRRPHRLPPDARRQPVRVERLADDRARHARAAARVARAGRQARRRRSAAHEDRRRSRRALAIRPGTDALFLFALVHVLFADDLVDLGTVAAVRRTASTRCARLAAEFTPEPVERRRAASTPRRSAAIAHELAAAPTAAVYGRIGTCTQEFGTLASWLVDVVNVCTGNLDRPGGAMFTLRRDGGAPPAARARAEACGSAAASRGVRGLPEFFGELPGRVPRRGDRDAGRGPDPRADHDRGQPGARRRRTRRGSTARSARSTSW